MYCKLHFIGSLNSNMRLLNFNCLLHNCRLATTVVTRQFCVHRINRKCFPEPRVHPVVRSRWSTGVNLGSYLLHQHIYLTYCSNIPVVWSLVFVYLFILLYFESTNVLSDLWSGSFKRPHEVPGSSSTQSLILWEENDFRSPCCWRVEGYGWKRSTFAFCLQELIWTNLSKMSLHNCRSNNPRRGFCTSKHQGPLSSEMKSCVGTYALSLMPLIFHVNQSLLCLSAWPLQREGCKQRPSTCRCLMTRLPFNECHAENPAYVSLSLCFFPDAPKPLFFSHALWIYTQRRRE